MYLEISLDDLEGNVEAIQLLSDKPVLIRRMQFEGDSAIIPFTEADELRLTLEHFQTAYNAGFKVQQGQFYIEAPIGQLNTQIPVDWPDSTYLAEDGETVVNRTFEDYAAARAISLDGTKVCLRCGHVRSPLAEGEYINLTGESVLYPGVNMVSLTHEELVKWAQLAGLANVMVASEGRALLASAAYTE